jgi:hypothetical protein
MLVKLAHVETMVDRPGEASGRAGPFDDDLLRRERHYPLAGLQGQLSVTGRYTD